MPNNNDLIKSVKCVFSEAITQNKQYIIPPYQRGYKWNRENVFKLLDDLKSFELGNVAGSESFYCIQNITIVSLQDGTGWNVVDGQQRLTTLYILLSYLKKFVKEDKLSFFSSPDCLRYEVRTETGKYLRDMVFTGKIWDQEINPDESPRKDEWYIRDVAKSIKDWFNIEGNHLLTSTIIERLMLIVNNMSEKLASEEEIFAGLNGGKVDLDGADLVRAVLITRSAKQKYQDSLASKVQEYRIRIALELDEMNLWWGNREQQTFFEQFLPENSFKTSIFDHDTHPIDLLYKLYYLIFKTDSEKFGIEFFENGRNFNSSNDDDHWELYESLMLLHHTLKLWFVDPRLYHWLGYLIFRFKGQSVDNKAIGFNSSDPNSRINFRFLWKLWEASATKDVFLYKIITSIQFLLNNREGNLLDDIRTINKQWYGKDSKGITDLLVLMDVMICTGIYCNLWDNAGPKKKPMFKIQDIKKSKTRLPAAYFTKAHENFEHIRSCAPSQEEGKEVREKKEWIEHINRNYAEVSNNTEEAKMKNALLEILNKVTEDTLNDSTINRLNLEMNKYGQHSLGNMALLDEHVNKSYGNDQFQKKIQRIFSEYMNDEWYIRPYTMTVFEHKIKDPDRSWRWTQQNIKENAENIASNTEIILNLVL